MITIGQLPITCDFEVYDTRHDTWIFRTAVDGYDLPPDVSMLPVLGMFVVSMTNVLCIETEV